MNYIWEKLSYLVFIVINDIHFKKHCIRLHLCKWKLFSIFICKVSTIFIIVTMIIKIWDTAICWGLKTCILFFSLPYIWNWYRLLNYVILTLKCFFILKSVTAFQSCAITVYNFKPSFSFLLFLTFTNLTSQLVSLAVHCTHYNLKNILNA